MTNTPLIDIGKKTLTIYAVILCVTGLLWLVALLHTVVMQLVIALVVSVALEPFVQFLMRRRLSRPWAILTAILVTLFGVVAFFSIIATPLVTQGSSLFSNIPQILNQLASTPGLQTLNNTYHLIDRLQVFAENQAGNLSSVSGPIVTVVSSIIGGVTSFVIILVFAFFFLLEGPENWRKWMRLLKPEQAKRVERVTARMANAISGFISGNLFISLIAGVVALITLLLLRIPYAFALAALLAVFDLIPLVGAALGTIAIALVGLTQGLLVTVIAIAILLLYQLIEGHVIQPVVYSRVISLSPLLIVLASVIGAELGGIIGVLLAIPAAAVLQIVVSEILAEGLVVVKRGS